MKKNWGIQHKWIPISLSSMIVLAIIITSVYHVSNRFHQPVQASSVVSVQLMDLPSSAKALPGEIVTNGTSIFWIDTRNEPSREIRGYNISQSQEFVVSSTGIPCANLRCNSQYVVWSDRQQSNPGIYGYNLSSQQAIYIRQVFPSTFITGLNISEDYLFWEENLDIMRYCFSNQQLITVNVGPKDQWNVQQDPTYVAWERLSSDNMVVRDIFYQDHATQTTQSINFVPLLTTSAINVYNGYISYLTREEPSNRHGILNIFHMVTQSAVKTVSLQLQNNWITNVKQITRIGTPYDSSSLHAIVNSVDMAGGYHPIYIDLKIGSQDPPILLPIEPQLPIDEIICCQPECPQDALDCIFLFHGEKSDLIANLSFYHLPTQTLYPIITNNSATLNWDKALRVDSTTIIFPITLENTTGYDEKGTPKYVVVNFN